MKPEPARTVTKSRSSIQSLGNNGQTVNAHKTEERAERQYLSRRSKAGFPIEQSIAFMTQNLNRPLQVAELAAQANVSSSYFFALFKRRAGSGPMKYFTRLRMRRACQMLKGTSLTIKIIAFDLGYHDSLYFSRVFKSVNRISPSKYRAKQWKMSDITIENSDEI